MARDEAYYKAEKKIEEALRSGITELDFGKMGLTELPETIGQLTQLKWLNLSNNELTTLPESVSYLVLLETLTLPTNKLHILPEVLEKLKQLQSLDVSNNQLTVLPESFGGLMQLKTLSLSQNQLVALPESLGGLTQLETLNLGYNQLTRLPEWVGLLVNLKRLHLVGNRLVNLPNSIVCLTKLKRLDIQSNKFSNFPQQVTHIPSLEEIWMSNNKLDILPGEIGKLINLQEISAWNNQLKTLPPELCQLSNLRELQFGYDKANGNLLTDIPVCLSELEHLVEINLDGNPLNPELAAAHEQGLDAVKLYLRLKIGPQIKLNEAKMILVGEGEVGKSCLLGALRGDLWEDGKSSTHGIEIKPVKVINPKNKTEITLNGWDFGGQRVYRPTHQLFFSAPAVYLVAWKSREGPQQGFVKEWIQLVKRREPSAKIIVVATHGGPNQRQPDIDRQELWDLFGKETVVDFFFVDSKPDKNGKRKGIEELKRAIARVAVSLPEVGRSVPKSFADVRTALQEKGVPYLSVDEVLDICRAHNMDDEIARLFIAISHRLGHLTHYENDPTLRDIVILRPDWLATAMSYVLDDAQTRQAHGMVKFSRLAQLWNDPARPTETRYPASLHRIFLALMGKFDLSYQVLALSPADLSDPQSLIAQLVQDNRPEDDLLREWVEYPNIGNVQQVQICRIVDKQSGQSATAEGLFYQLIVRLHKYSLGRFNFHDSVHWQRGLLLQDEYKSRAFLEYIGNDVRITVRAPYPEGLLGMLTREVKFLVESFWEGLRCDVMVPCIEPCGREVPGTGLFGVSNLIESKREGEPKFPCPTCNKWQNIDELLRNAPAASQTISLNVLQSEFALIKDKLDEVNSNTLRVLSQVDKTYTDLIQVFTDEAKEGPRLFSLFPLDRSNFNPKNWVRAQFRLVLWCEYSRRPLPAINGLDSKKGVYDLELDREWFKKAAPYLKLMMTTLSLVLPVVSSELKIANPAAFKTLEDQLDLGKNIIDAVVGEGTALHDFIGTADSSTLEHGVAVRADGATLRELQVLLKAKDPGYGGLVRVLNKRQEFLWVHEKFAGEY